NVLADLALESEAATVLAMRLAGAVDAGETDLIRVGVPVAKYWLSKRVIVAVAEAMECLGGNGYVEENGISRLYRDAPVATLGGRRAAGLQASRRGRHAPAPVASAFLATRVSGGGGLLLGTLPVGRRTTQAIVDRALPADAA